MNERRVNKLHCCLYGVDLVHVKNSNKFCDKCGKTTRGEPEYLSVNMRLEGDVLVYFFLWKML